jgi:hypothetical protein
MTIMAKRKEHSRGTLKVEEKFTCTNSLCGFVFSRPIKVKNLFEDSEIYDACPRCFTALNGIASVPVTEAELNPCADAGRDEVSPKVTINKTEQDDNKQCARGFGYLSKRAKNENIPDDCMTCDKIVKCMTKGMTA